MVVGCGGPNRGDMDGRKYEKKTTSVRIGLKIPWEIDEDRATVLVSRDEPVAAFFTQADDCTPADVDRVR